MIIYLPSDYIFALWLRTEIFSQLFKNELALRIRDMTTIMFFQEEIYKYVSSLVTKSVYYFWSCPKIIGM